VLTREGYERLRKELEHLIRVRRPQVAQRLREAREFGDIRENAEFAAAKEEQAQIEARIAELERLLRGARVVD
jgi:transcription elongation factor GreA